MHSVQRSNRSQHSFSQSPQASIPRAKFDRSHGYKTTFNAGYLVPVFCDEVLPGDTFNLRMTAFARLATPIFPIMDNLIFESFFFFVPNRLVWDNWERFNGAQDNPSSSTDFIVPTITSPGGGVLTGSLADYFGIPILVAGLEYNSLPFRAYNLIYNQWFRDENLQNSVVVDLDDGPDTYTDYVLLRRGKRYDYFTSCLPWPQKINDGTTVSIPLGVSAPVKGLGVIGANGAIVGTHYETGATTIPNGTYGWSNLVVEDVLNSSGTAGASGHFPNILADLSNATAASINQLRQAFQLQKLYERDARGGTRYIEILKSHFGVTSPDQRLQRAEFLHGGRSFVNINPVAQTAPTSGSNALGDLGAFGTLHASGHGFTKSFVEHGFVIGIVSVRADLNYQQGLNRMWSREIRWDYYWPALSHIGEQAVLNKEIFAQGTSADNDVFGYNERYAEYRYKPSLVTGLFNSNAAGTLDAWHLAQDFASLPTLNTTFIQETPPMSRIKAVTSEPDFIMDCFLI